MRRSKPLTSEAGFTMVELLVSMVLAMAVVLTITFTTTSASRMATSIRMDSALNSMLGQIQSALQDPSACAVAWKTAVLQNLDINPAAAPVTVPRFELAGARVAEIGKRNTGLLVQNMQLVNPVQIAGNRYRWTFKVTTAKTDPSGASYGGEPIRVSNFRAVLTTNGGANISGTPNYQVVSCGTVPEPLAVARAPIAFHRITAGNPAVAANATLAVKDDACKLAFDGGYNAASVLDMASTRAAKDTGGGALAGATTFVVALDSANSYTLIGAAGQITGSRVVANGSAAGSVACASKTAPLRFTRDNVAGNATSAAKDNVCMRRFGPNYRAASIADMVTFGFVYTNGAIAGGSAEAAVFMESGIVCGLGYSTRGPAIGCGAAVTAHPLACIAG